MHANPTPALTGKFCLLTVYDKWWFPFGPSDHCHTCCSGKKNKVSEFDGEPETKLSPMNIMSPFGFKSEKIWLRTGLIKKGNHGFSGN